MREQEIIWIKIIMKSPTQSTKFMTWPEIKEYTCLSQSTPLNSWAKIKFNQTYIITESQTKFIRPRNIHTYSQLGMLQRINRQVLLAVIWTILPQTANSRQNQVRQPCSVPSVIPQQARSQRFALGGSDFKTQKATPTFVSSLILLQY